ncbi:3-phytase [Pseudoalteromonas tetraodonis GFC]|mgnify:FL=1|uniref:3-phytase n=1 Tax=Pseudoalteromonas tetraodonis GFC TaxID=1315271 RepID=A0AA37W2N4_9GAMM|nr:phytase [Pseudoalteromonas tetraodonis]ATD02476.1 3-phytase [Pseudoalteromonas tetraodonis]GEN38429.1 3-phytase [Pseudoalteromonas tetraodonis GFC]GLQ03454.1 3-phytase [Pseudoalteromonas tetraodonis GFC]
MNFKLNTISAVLGSALLLTTISGCTRNNDTQNNAAVTKPYIEKTDIETKLFGPQQNMQGSQAASLGNNQWLIASESQGLLLADNEKDSVLLAGNFESISLKKIAAQQFLLATLDNNQDNVVIFKLIKNGQTWQLNELTRISPPQAQPDAVCLFKNSNNKTVSAFVPDVRGLISETVIYDLATNQAKNIAVREFSAVTEASGCAVNDDTKTLYVGEAELGVWAINADAESDANKQPVALVQPYGELNSEIGALSVSQDGTLWLSATDGNKVYAYQAQTDKLSQWSLAGEHTIESVAASFINDSQAQLVLIDDETGAYIQASVNYTAQTATSQNNVAMTHLHASAQTTPVAAFGDAADDPAIWINQQDAKKSLILGTDKRRGLMVYDLAGSKVQSLNVGRLNNVDVRQHQGINNQTHTWITASNRTLNSISVFTVDGDNQVNHVTEIATNLSEIYGMCMYSSESGHYVFVNDKSGLFQQYKLTGEQSNLSGELVREFTLPSQPEGCSADDNLGQLFAGEEDAGIWYIGAEPTAGNKAVKLQRVNEQLVADVEGMEIYHANDARYLVVSSQGDNSYVLYKISDDKEPSLSFAGKFNVIANLDKGIDGVGETDGLTVTATALPGYPEGMLIVQDGYNRMPLQPQNFKIIDWREVKKAIR